MTADPNHELRRNTTADAAAAFLEDFDHLRTLTARPRPTRLDARHTSGALRRLLLEGDLLQIAAPRVGKIAIEAPDFSSAQVGAATTQGLVAFYGLDPSFPPLPFDSATMGGPIVGYSPRREHFTVERFTNQKIIYFEQRWISRREMVRYVANQKSGVHSNNERALLPDLHGILAKLESTMTLSDEQGMPVITFADAPRVAPQSTYQVRKLNIVLLTMLSTAHALVTSSDVVRLAEVIRTEIGWM